ncbi:stage III sporulation protein AF [Desulfitispora alkaliphila]|uniref:stage III sporulation protein AF n=1 Tax=Desulfitispora alkaliphila TaxID=622674 RepID=UPI003D25308B
MDTLTNLVRDIAVIVILASFMEMLLPTSNMKRFVQLVLGLFIIITILTPITAALNQDLSRQVSAWNFQVEEDQLDQILAQGKEISQISNQEALRSYEKNIEKQITGLMALIPEISDAQVDVSAEELSATGFGGIKGVHVIVSKNGQVDRGSQKEQIEGIDEIEPIEIEIDLNGGESKKEVELSGLSIEKRIKELIANFYGIPADKIHVEIKD